LNGNTANGIDEHHSAMMMIPCPGIGNDPAAVKDLVVPVLPARMVPARSSICAVRFEKFK